MFSLGFCAKIRPVFLSKGRLLLACASHSQFSHTHSSVSPAPAPSPRLSFLRQVKILQTENLAHVITRRQIQIKSSARKHQLQFSQYNWDKVPSDFNLVYQNNLKNWIWGYYISQLAIAATCSWFARYMLQDLLNSMSDLNIKLMIVCCSIMMGSCSYINFIATRTCIRIYYNSHSGQFLAVRRTCLGRLRKIFYTPSDIILCNKHSDDIDMTILIKVKGKKYQLASSDFVSPEYWNKHVVDTSYNVIKDSYSKGPRF